METTTPSRPLTQCRRLVQLANADVPKRRLRADAAVDLPGEDAFVGKLWDHVVDGGRAVDLNGHARARHSEPPTDRTGWRAGLFRRRRPPPGATSRCHELAPEADPDTGPHVHLRAAHHELVAIHDLAADLHAAVAGTGQPRLEMQ